MVAYNFLSFGVAFAACVAATRPVSIEPRQSVDNCPGYKAANVKTTASGLTATLSLAGTACNVYGTDVQKLKLEVTAESGKQPLSPCMTS